MGGLKLLLTSGATREPIDEARYLSNVSTGRTGALLGDFFVETGFEVAYLRGEGAREPAHPCRISGFTDYRSLDQALERELREGDYFAVIHLAAVSDYSVQSVLVGGKPYRPEELKKVDSGEELGLVLKKNTKILDRLREYGSRGRSRAPLVVGFKLTSAPNPEAHREAVERIARGRAVDLVVHNDLGQIRAGGAHVFQVFRTAGGEAVAGPVCLGIEELGAALVKCFKEIL